MKNRSVLTKATISIGVGTVLLYFSIGGLGDLIYALLLGTDAVIYLSTLLAAIAVMFSMILGVAILYFGVNLHYKNLNRKFPKMMYLFPIIFGIFGGIVCYFIIRKRDRKIANNLLIIGLVNFAMSIPIIFILNII